ncbi:transglycosylase SLT domain-containing protein [Streptomyces profundus]|nr:transglycosylase SLT domain-containing protein [Streptomyces sp. MA3_2.13]UED88617.1 transglycosylase SLT domain-containing protein [Streptomyces sp. MA3_2.13]
MAAEADGVTRAAEGTSAPAAFAPEGADGPLGQATTAGGDEERDVEKPVEEPAEDRAEKAAEKDEPKPEPKPESDGVDGRADGFDEDEGRGEDYHDDGSLVVIPKHEQPTPEPASDEEIDGWIREALEVLEEEGIPASYEGIHKNLMRESSGDPLTINLWDTNAEQDIPSKGLLQVIDPTFEQYHVEGTSENIYDPVANIAAACNYAADRYGSMDNVDSAY